MQRKVNLMIILLTASALASLSCTRKDLLFENLDVALAMTVDATDPLLGEMDPGSTYRGLVYDAATGTQDGYSFVGPTGGTLRMHAGRRAAVVHTFGCEASYIVDEGSLGEAAVTTNAADQATQEAWRQALDMGPAGNVPGEDSIACVKRHEPWRQDVVRWEPDPMWAAVIGPLAVPHRDEGEVYGVSATARPVFRSLRIILADVEGMTWISGVEAFIRGTAAARALWFDEPSGGLSVLKMQMYRAGSTALLGQSCLFGFIPEGDVRLVVVVTDTGRGRHLYEYDITEDARKGEAIITLPAEMAIPEPENPGGGGFLPTLEDWKTTTVPVPL